MGKNLSELLHDTLLDAGASLVGYADIRSLPSEASHGLPRGIAIACAIRPEFVLEIADGPTKSYEAEYGRLNSLLDHLARLAESIIEKHGYHAVAMAATQSVLDEDTLATPLPQKTTARLAGLGWIGKCALLVTEEYGSAVRLNTVLTDAPLTTGSPVDESRCGKCVACVEICPAGAPLEPDWNPGMGRSEFFDAFACYEEAKKVSSRRGIRETICGRCIACCPWTKKYINLLTH